MEDVRVSPIIIPPSPGPTNSNTSVFVTTSGKTLVNIRNLNYVLYHSVTGRFEHAWGPLVYLHGAQNIVPGLERELAGRKTGDSLKVHVAPKDGYGDWYFTSALSDVDLDQGSAAYKAAIKKKVPKYVRKYTPGKSWKCLGCTESLAYNLYYYTMFRRRRGAIQD
jgi:hypothetical protein